MIECQKCRYHNIEDASFCNKCGNMLHSQTSSAPPPLSENKLLVGWFIPLKKPSVSIKVMGKNNDIGRTDDSTIDLSYYMHYPPEPDLNTVSRKHAKIVYDSENDKVGVIDIDSSNKSYVNNRELVPYERVELVTHSILKLGKLELKFKKFSL